MGLLRTIVRLMAIAALAHAVGPAPASAHPHVWVQAETTVLFGNGSQITGLTHKWTFDEFYTAMAIEGLDKTEKGKFTRQDLAELTKTNMEGLKEFGYFTFPKLADRDLEMGEPVDAYLEVGGDKQLSLYFTLPLKQPLLAEAMGFNFAVVDPSFFIAFEWVKANPIKLGAGAPAGCIAKVQGQEREPEEAKKLGDAFAKEFGGVPGGISSSERAIVDCSQAAAK